MEVGQEGTQQEQENLSSDVNESLGVQDAGGESENGESSDKTHDPLYVQKRLKQQKRSHEREIRELHSRINELQSRGTPEGHNNASENPYSDGGQPGVMDEQIHRAVGFALKHKEMQEQQAKQHEQQAHVQRQYGELQRHLDNAADKYDDFDDVVRGPHAAFTPHMRDAALMLPKSGAGSAAETLYKLGKNPDELSRIAKLHPLDQASELVKLSHALISGGEQKGNTLQRQHLGQVKNNPVVNSAGVTEKTSPSSIRALMKQGKFK